MKKKMTVSNLLYAVSMLFAVGVLLKNYYDQSQLPPGVCPIDNNRGLMTVSILLLIGVTIGTSIYDYKKKKAVAVVFEGEKIETESIEPSDENEETK